MPRIPSERTVKRMQLAEEYTKSISKFKRRKRLLKEALIENGVKQQSLVSASMTWMEEKADELGLIIGD